MMEVRVGLLFLLALGISWACDARQLLTTDSTVLSGYSVSVLQARGESYGALEQVACILCEEFTARALDYLANNKTQTDIIAMLHSSCSQFLAFQQKCVGLVDYYAPLFFLEISMIKPGNFCQEVNLCVKPFNSLPPSQGSCEFCHRAVAEVLIKLKDPDRQLFIMELLLKGCDAVEAHMKKCKLMVLEYGPLILSNAELVLETTDICNTTHACLLPPVTGNHASSLLSHS